MINGSGFTSTITILTLLTGLSLSSIGFASDDDQHHHDRDVQFAINPDTTVLYLKSDITKGAISGIDCDGSCINADGSPWLGVGFPANPTTIHWQYSGDVYAADVSERSGKQKGPGRLVGSVSGSPEFPATFGMLSQFDTATVASMLHSETLPWTCTDCNLQVGGSTFAKVNNMPLTGRAFIGFGPVSNAEGYLALRMGGCAGIQEVSGEGKYANMMGTICLNGTIGFQMDFSGVGTSNCVMVLQQGPYAAIVD